MINTRPLNQIQDPFQFFFGGPIIGAQDLIRLNAELPARELYRREIKVGPEHKKQYNMSRVGIFEQGVKTETAAHLPAAWAELLDELLSAGWREWLTNETGIELTDKPVTIGLYIFENGDFTSVDNGKLAKALSVALYLNDEWSCEYGGNLEVWRTKDEPGQTPAQIFVPLGGNVSVCRFGESSWHSIGAVRNGCSRVSMMIEYWQDEEPAPR
jgi:SM-20-related protein